MMKKLLSCAVALAFFSGVASASSNLVVSTEGGQLEGFTKTVPGTQSKVETFLAVPFAAAPVGENRWKSAQPVVPWKGVKKANKAPQACRQGDVGSEDCLYVNIYRPAGIKKDAKLAVGVYAHGGGNTGGNATEHDGARLASENNIIVVTLQYRLGAFGFLTLPGMDENASIAVGGRTGASAYQYYVNAGNNIYYCATGGVPEAPVLVCSIPAEYGEVEYLGLSALGNRLVVVAYDESSSEERKGTVLFVDLSTRQITHTFPHILHHCSGFWGANDANSTFLAGYGDNM